MRIAIEIDCGDAAIDENPHGELSRILTQLALDIGLVECEIGEAVYRRIGHIRRLHDVNGNSVGTVKVETA